SHPSRVWFQTTKYLTNRLGDDRHLINSAKWICLNHWGLATTTFHLLLPSNSHFLTRLFHRSEQIHFSAPPCFGWWFPAPVVKNREEVSFRERYLLKDPLPAPPL